MDIATLIKFQLASVKIFVTTPTLILPSTKISTDPYVYDAYYKVENMVLEKGGLHLGNGMLIV